MEPNVNEFSVAQWDPTFGELTAEISDLSCDGVLHNGPPGGGVDPCQDSCASFGFYPVSPKDHTPVRPPKVPNLRLKSKRKRRRFGDCGMVRCPLPVDCDSPGRSDTVKRLRQLPREVIKYIYEHLPFSQVLHYHLYHNDDEATEVLANKFSFC